MGNKAIILGATGLTGRHLLDILLKDSFYDEVLVFTRRSLNMNHPKLKENITDLLELHHQQDDFKADVVFCCIGTTKAKTPNLTRYKAIDYGIPVTAASLCKDNNIPCLLVISSLGANAGSKIFYNRIKGEMEKAVLNKRLPKTYILRPSLITGNRDEKRRGETVAKSIMTLLSPILIGPLKQYQPIDSITIARAMVLLSKGNSAKSIIPSSLIKEIAAHGV